ncbi:glycoside hydrolase family 88 protein [Opitutus sp. GAS368]|uniref:glycoside hydrolase family 88/105 protein n=1 Tax=Opitutus sp. GAS368 TaxID=1882749 RepID=UPI000879EF4B|nr:glycoside hydrolase family 88 protein [Opitutus sp. GAS368]SDR67342.1 Rhamnogalacturonyl hydrolase YesR [Opitutus sp. GAS368]
MSPLPRLASLLTLGLALAGATVATAKYDFGPWPAGTSPQEIGRRVAENFAAKPHSNFNRPGLPNSITYPETCTWYGALAFAQLAGDKNLTTKLVARFEPLFGPEAGMIPKPANVDATVFGAVPLELYIQTKEKRYLEVGLNLADKQWEAPTPEQLDKLKPEPRAIAEQALKEGLTWHTRYWIDDMFMITMVQAQAYRATGDRKYIDRTAREMVSYLDQLQQPNGLFYHAPDVPFFWGRGDGWMAAGSAQLLSSLPADHPARARIMEGYKKMMAALLQHQRADGMWGQLIDDPASWPESSCTGMFAYAFITGVKQGWLDEQTYGPAAKKAWLALITCLEPNADIREVCEGTNKKNDRQYYLDRKRNTGDFHGQAPVLWCAAALLR